MGTVSQRLNAVDREAQRAFSGFAKIGDRLTTIGTAVTGAVTLPLAAAGAAATKFAADFEAEMRKVTSLLGGATQKEFDALNKQVLALSRSMGVDAVKSAEALYEVISAGIPKENAIGFLEQATKTAIAGVTDTKVAVDALTTIIAAYGLSVTEANKVSDAMFQAVNVGKFQFEDLAKAIGPAAAQAANLGISYEELLAATSTLSITSGGVSIAVTQIESAMRALLDPTKEMKAAFTTLGYETGSAAVKALGFEGTLEALRKTTGGSAEAFNALFGRIEGASGALGLTGPRAAQAAKDYNTLKSSSEGLGATQKALDEINKGTARQFEVLSAQLKVTAIELGTALLPAVNDLLIAARPLVDILAGMVRAFTALPQPIQTAAVGVGALVIAAGPAIASIGLLTTTVINAARAMKALSEATLIFDIGKALTGQLIGPLTLTQSRIVALLSPITLLKTVVTDAAAAIRAMGSALIAADIGKVITGQFVGPLTLAQTRIVALLAPITLLKTVAIEAAIAIRAMGAAVLAADFGAVITGQLVGPLTLAQSRVVSFLSALKGLAVPITIGVVTYQALDALTKTETATNNLKKAQDEQRKSMDLLNQKYREQEVAAGRLFPIIDKGKDIVFDFVKNLKAVPGALDAVKKATGGVFSDADRKRIEEFKKEIIANDEKTHLHNQALRELGKEVKDAGEKHKEAAPKVRQFLDLFPVLAAKLGIVTGEYNKSLQAIAEYELAIERGEKSTVDFTEGLVSLADAIPPLNAQLLEIPEHIKRMEESMKDSVKPVEAIIDAYHRLGLETPHELQKTVDANRAAWETIVKDSGSQSVVALEAWIKYEESRQAAARRSGEVIPEEQRKGLEKAQAQLDAALGKQTGSWGKFTQQVSTIINDFAKDLARGTVDLIKNLFDFDGFNKKLREDSQKLRDELAGRADAIEQFQTETAAKIANVQSGYAEQLATETTELRDALAERVAEHEQYVQNVTEQLENLRNTEGERLAEELGQLADALRDKEAAYQEYQLEVAAKETEIRESHAARLREQLADLEDNLRDRQQAYDRFVEDANTSLRRIGEDLNETIDDATRGSNRRIEDENTDFARDQQKLNEDIRKADLKGDKELSASLRKQLAQRTEDHEKALKRLREDLAEQISDAKDRAKEQTDDLQKNLTRRAADHAEYVKENVTQQREVTEKNRESLDEQLKDLQQSIDKRTKELLKFREDTKLKQDEAIADSKAKLDKEEADLQKSLNERKGKLDAYAVEVEQKLAALTALYEKNQAEEVAALNLELANKLKEYDAYRVGVEEKLEELADAHKGPLDRIKDMFVGVFDAAANAIARLLGEEYIGKLFDKLEDLVKRVLPSVGKAVTDNISNIPGLPDWVTGGTPTPSAPGGVPSTGGAGGSSPSGLGGTVDLITGAISAAANVISAIYNVRIEGTLNQMERNTAAIAIHAENLLKKANEYWPKSADILATLGDLILPTLREIRDGLKNLFSVNVNLTDDEQRKLVSSLITRVGTFDTTASDRLQDIYARLGGVLTATQDVGKSVRDSLATATSSIVAALGGIEKKLPSTLENALGGNILGGVAGLAGTLPAAISGLIAGLVRGGGKTDDLIEENTRFTAVALLGPAGVVMTLRDYLPKLADIQDFNINTLSPWLTHMKAWTEPGGQWFDRTVQMIDLIAQRVVPPLDILASAVTPGAEEMASSINVRVFLDGREISNSITASDELGGGAI